ncbi:MAG TPA: extracellular solute-binding protein [Lichenihabitans sp.]|jgi:spermidine/putrescine transport system substrate-binding protein|nr:extracellular solute-binding protein [Lichenihabitans sp.]
MRRHVLAGLLVVAAAVAPQGPALAQSKQLVLFNWSNYMPPDLLKRFEKETGIAVTLDTYDTNESMLAKIQAGGSGYDVAVPSGPTVQTMIRDGLVLKIDANAMPNFKNVRAPFDKPDFDPQRAYSAPYMWGTTAIAYDTAKVPGGKIDDSWKELFEPRPEFVGKIGMLKDEGEVIGAAAYYLGYDYCTADPKEGQKILELLEKQKPAVKVYNAEGTVDRVASGEVAMELMWNGSFHRAHKKLPTVAYVFPKEGVNLWGDNFVVPKGAGNIENAKTFINWMLDPKNAAEATNFTGYNNTITGSEQFLDASLRDDPAVNVSKETMALFRPIKECSKAALDLRDKIWTRLLR